ncbi:MAG: hypothetical protein RR212_14505 [Bacteroidales bacterium]
MKTLLYLQNNTFESSKTLEYIIDLAQYLNMALKIIHIQFPDTIVANQASGNQLFQPPDVYLKAKEEYQSQTKKNIELLVKQGKIKKEIPFEYYSGMPAGTLSYLYSIGYFDMLVLENENTKVSLYPYLSIKEIIRFVKCPIWIIPRDKSFTPMTHFTYFSAYQEEDVNAIGFLLNYFKNNISSFNTIYFCTHNSFDEEIKRIGYEAFLKEKTECNFIKSHIYVTEKNSPINQIVNKCIEKDQADLVIALKDNKNFFQQLFYKSFISTILSDIEYPILILHRENFIKNNNAHL